MRDVHVWTSDIPRRFLETLDASDPWDIYISSPWITEFQDSTLNLPKILSAKKAHAILLTRPPRKRHELKMLLGLRSKGKARIYVHPRLHAKLYIIDGPKSKHVLIGSPNLTQEARGNVEIGLLVSGNDLFMKRVIYQFLGYLKPMCRRWDPT
jgi:hypothetical protein